MNISGRIFMHARMYTVVRYKHPLIQEIQPVNNEAITLPNFRISVK
jgi:hypothetical protein